MKKLIYLFLTIVFICQYTIAQVPSYVPTDGLVGYWPFDGNANDASGNGNNGVVNGAVLTLDRNNLPNSAYSFNGNTNCIDIANSPELELTDSDYSISLWVYFNSTGSDLISKRDGSGGGYSLTTNSTEYFVWHWTDPSGSLSSYNFSEWSNVTLVYSENLQELKLYVNGILLNTTSLQSVSANSGILRFGGDALLNTYWHNGMMDDIGIWNRPLTQQEITDLYNSILSTNTASYESNINIYPNPANEHITIDFGNLDNVEGWNIKIINILGQEVLSQPMDNDKINVSELSKGVYIIRISDGVNQADKKFIKN